MHSYARRSLLSVLLTSIAITVNHYYVLGPGAFALGAAVAGGALVVLIWFRSTRSAVAFGGYLLINAWIVFGFGLLKGFWGIALPLYAGTLLASLSSSFPNPTLGAYPYEASGLLMFIGSLFAAYYAYRMIEARHSSATENAVRAGRARGLRYLALVATSALLTFTAAYGFADRDSWKPPANGVVRIAVLVPSAGPYSILGNSFLRAVEMAQADLPKTKYKYELVVVDVGTNPAVGRAAIRQVVQQGRVDAILGGISLFGQVTKPLATAARLPHLCVCSVTTIADGAYNFTNIPPPEAEAVRWVEEARRRGITRVSLMSQNYPSISNHVRALKAEALAKGLTITSEQTFDGASADFGSIIAQAKAGTPDVYYVEAFEPALDRLAQQLGEAGVHNLSSVVAPSLSPRPELFEGVWYTDSDLRDFGFKTRFERKYPGVQFATHMMPYAYDDFNLLVQAFERGENPAVYIRNIRRFDGTAGPLSKDVGSGIFQSMPAVWVIKDGKPALSH